MESGSDIAYKLMYQGVSSQLAEVQKLLLEERTRTATFKVHLLQLFSTMLQREKLSMEAIGCLQEFVNNMSHLVPGPKQ